MTEDPYRFFCEQRQKAHRSRSMVETKNLNAGRAEREGKVLVNFSSNDYLGLSRHPLLIARLQEYAARYGAGATASRLVTGNGPPYAALEKTLAHGKGCEASLILNSGYQANISVLAALADKEVIGKPVTILADRLCHYSLLQGALLSGVRLIRFHHNDTDHLADLARQQTERGAHLIIVSESVFGMDGDRADLTTLISLARRFHALLYIDEAHATGLYGLHGFGLAAEHRGAIDVVMGTFGKALGSFGAYIACNQSLRDYLIQRCGGLIYSTALPPSVLGSIEAALEMLPGMESERSFVEKQSLRLRCALEHQGWNCGASTTHIIPVHVGDEQAATALALELRQAGFLIPCIRPPTVPRGTSRLRISLSAAHSEADIDQLIDVMAEKARTFLDFVARSLAS